MVQMSIKDIKHMRKALVLLGNVILKIKRAVTVVVMVLVTFNFERRPGTYSSTLGVPRV